MLPAVTFRVLANGGSPCGLLLLVQRDQVGVGHVDFAADLQHRRHVAGRDSRSGTSSIVRTLWVMSSPTRPLPRVTPRVSRPSS